jgi:hypothetical protein
MLEDNNPATRAPGESEEQGRQKIQRTGLSRDVSMSDDNVECEVLQTRGGGGGGGGRGEPSGAVWGLSEENGAGARESMPTFAAAAAAAAAGNAHEEGGVGADSKVGSGSSREGKGAAVEVSHHQSTRVPPSSGAGTRKFPMLGMRPTLKRTDSVRFSALLAGQNWAASLGLEKLLANSLPDCLGTDSRSFMNQVLLLTIGCLPQLSAHATFPSPIARLLGTLLPPSGLCAACFLSCPRST